MAVVMKLQHESFIENCFSLIGHHISLDELLNKCGYEFEASLQATLLGLGMDYVAKGKL